MKHKTTALTLLSQLISVQVLAGTIAYFRFEEGGGGFVSNEVGSFHASLDASSTEPGAGDTGAGGWSTNVASAVIPQTGTINTGSIHFPGAEVRITPETTEIAMGTAFTVEFFFRLDYSYGGAFFALRPLYFSCSDSLGDRYLNGQFFSELTYHIATNIVLHQWYHLALVKTPGQYSIYLDGIHQFTDALPSGTDGPYTSIYQYYYPRTIGGTFYGWIDEFRISNVALTPDQFLIAPWRPALESVAHTPDGIQITLSNALAGVTTVIERAQSMTEPLIWHTAATLSVEGNTTNWTMPLQDDGQMYFRAQRED